MFTVFQFLLFAFAWITTFAITAALPLAYSACHPALEVPAGCLQCSFAVLATDSRGSADFPAPEPRPPPSSPAHRRQLLAVFRCASAFPLACLASSPTRLK